MPTDLGEQCVAPSVEKIHILTCAEKEDLRLCSTYRTIAVIFNASKIVLRIIQCRLATYIKREMPEEQAGFRKGRGTRDQTASIGRILERAMEYGKKIYSICASLITTKPSTV
jgi:hypothetical protein